MLVGGLSTEMVKEPADKHSPPENCKYLSMMTVKRKISDLLSRKTCSLDLLSSEFKGVTGIVSLTNLAGNWVKHIIDGKTPDTCKVLNHVMDSVALLINTNRRINVRRQELLKPDLNFPYTPLCKEDIKPSTKLFGDDLSKHLKEKT